MMASLADEEEDEDAAEMERELDGHMRAFEGRPQTVFAQ